MPAHVAEHFERIIRRVARRGRGVSRPVGIAATASYLPERWMSAAEIAARERDPGDGHRREVRPARQAHRRSRRARQRHGGRRGRAPARRDAASIRSTIDVVMYCGSMLEGLRRLAGGSLDRPPPRLRRTRTPSSTTTSRWARRRRSARRAALLASEPRVAERSSSSPPPASRTSSTTGTRAPASCSTSGTARARRCSSADESAQRAPRLARDHRRLALAAGEGARRRLGRAGIGPLDRLNAATSSTSPDPEEMKRRLDAVSLPNFVAVASGGARALRR